ncbi:MAG: hypothetical protein FH753_11445 [Firmicutes bacterium]|nr:hypothetical protein [Bacillota bacterium]
MIGYDMFLKWLLDATLKGSFIIFFIFLIKFIFKERQGAKWHYYIWFLIIIKLMSPFSPKSEISIFNIFHINKTTSFIEEVKENKDNTYLFTKDYEFANKNNNYTKEKTKDDKNLYFFMIWAIGFTIFSFKLVKSNIKLSSNIKNNYSLPDEDIIKIFNECKKTMNIKGNISIYNTDFLKAPILYGVFKPCILLPKGINKLLNKNELKYVILHELSHFKRKDIIIFNLLSILQTIHWFNPIIWYGFYKMREDCEIACDEMALSYVKSKDYKNYGFTIVKLVENSKYLLRPTGIAGVGYKSQLKRRISMIKLFNKNKHKLSILSISVFILLAAIFLTNPSTEKNRLNGNANITNQGENSKEYTIDKLNKAVIVNDIDLVNQIIKSKSVDINKKNSEGRYPLEEVFVMNNCDMAKILLKAGANPHVKTSDGVTIYKKAMKTNSQYLKKIFKGYK